MEFYNGEKMIFAVLYLLNNVTIIYKLNSFLPRDELCASHGIITVSRPSVCLFVTLMYRGRMYWVNSKVITQITTNRFIWSKITAS